MPKENTYTAELLLKVLANTISSEGTIDTRVGPENDDPRRIASNLAAVPPTSVQSLVEKH